MGTTMLNSPEMQEQRIKSVAIRALTETFLHEPRKEPVDAIKRKFKLSDQDVIDTAIDSYKIAIRTGKNIIAADIAKSRHLGDQWVISAVEKPYLNYVENEEFLSAARIAKKYGLPDKYVTAAVESAFSQSIQRVGGRLTIYHSYVGDPQEVMKEFGIPNETVLRIAGAAYESAIDKDPEHAAYLAKDFDLGVQKKKIAANKFYNALMGDKYGHYYADRPEVAVRVAVEFELGRNKKKKALEAALYANISDRHFDVADQLSKEHKMDKEATKGIAFNAYKRLHAYPLAAFEVLKHYLLEVVPEEERGKLVLRCYNSLEALGEHVAAASLAIDEKLGEEKVIKSITNELDKLTFQNENLQHAMQFADKCVTVLKSGGYNPAMVEKIRKRADDIAECAFRATLTISEHDRIRMKPDEVIKAHPISPERQREIATEVYDAEAMRPDRANYSWLLTIATKYGLDDGRINRAREVKYARTLEFLGYGDEFRELARELPEETATKIETDAVLNLLRRNEDGAVRLIRRITDDHYHSG